MPEAIGWWPIAPGWWLLLIFGLLLTCLGLWFSARHRQRNLYRKQSMGELRAIHSQWTLDADDSQYVQAANAIIKRALSAAGSDAHSSSLTGPQWVKIIDSWSAGALSEESASALVKAGYQQNPRVDISRLHRELSGWLHSHKNPGSQNSQSAGAHSHA